MSSSSPLGSVSRSAPWSIGAGELGGEPQHAERVGRDVVVVFERLAPELGAGLARESEPNLPGQIEVPADTRAAVEL